MWTCLKILGGLLMSDNRGVIHTENRARQLIRFEGIRYGKITPTDIDALIEYHNQAYIFIEVKHLYKQLDLGQRLALQRMVDDATKAGKIATAFVLEHDITNPVEDVYLSKCKIRTHYFQGRWHDHNKGKFPKEVFDKFIEFVDMTKGGKNEGGQQ